MLALEARKAALALPLTDAPKEVLIRGVEVLEGSLQRGGVHFAQPFKFRLESRQAVRLFEARRSRACGLVALDAFVQEVIVDEAAAAERLLDQSLLLSCRIQAELIAVLYGRLTSFKGELCGLYPYS